MRICLILNPKSGLSNRWLGSSPLEEIVSFFDSEHISVTIKTTAKQGDGAALAIESAAQGYTHILACGGDGTINEALNGIEGSGAVLGIIPLGTVNVLASAMGVPLDVQGACRHFLDSPERAIDIGVAKGRNFLIMSGVGFDAQVMAEMDPALKALLGSIGYILKGGVKLLFSEDGPPPVATLRFFDSGAEHRLPTGFVVVGNLPNYSTDLRLALNATPDDGMLDIVVFPAAGSLDWINQAMSALAERHLEDGTIHYFTSKDFEISCEPPLNCHIDGELIGTTPVRYAVKPGALRIRF